MLNISRISADNFEKLDDMENGLPQLCELIADIKRRKLYEKSQFNDIYITYLVLKKDLKHLSSGKRNLSYTNKSEKRRRLNE